MNDMKCSRIVRQSLAGTIKGSKRFCFHLSMVFSCPFLMKAGIMLLFKKNFESLSHFFKGGNHVLS